MDQARFDSLTRSLAGAKTRRGLLAGLAALAVGARASSAQEACTIPGQTRNAKGTCTCPAGSDPCPGGCVDKKRDPNDCGSCGNVCPADAVCVKGKCVCPAGGCTTTTTTTAAPTCTPDGQTCDINDPGACCSQACSCFSGPCTCVRP